MRNPKLVWCIWYGAYSCFERLFSILILKHDFISGEFTKKVIEDQSPPANLLSLCSKIMFGEDKTPYPEPVHYTASSFIFNYKKRDSRADVSKIEKLSSIYETYLLATELYFFVLF